MRKFRRKPTIVQAVQITKSTFEGAHPNPEHIHGVVYNPDSQCAYVHTLNGIVKASLGDWIIIDAKGVPYPCNPEVFESVYEEVLDDVPQPTELKDTKTACTERPKGSFDVHWEIGQRPVPPGQAIVDLD